MKLQHDISIVHTTHPFVIARGGASEHRLIRVRLINGRSVLTYKGPAEPSKYKKRPELEIDLPNGASMEAIFIHMGYRPVFRYEKFRTEYVKRASDSGTVLLDETPVGNFLEIEGSPRKAGPF